MPFAISGATAGLIAAGVGAAGAIGGALISSSAAGNAAGQQAQSAANALGVQDATTIQNETNQAPFIIGGDAGLSLQPSQIAGYQPALAPYQNALAAAMPTVPQPMTQAQLEQTPGYQFQLQQGLMATQNAAAARGLGVSGAALKGAATYATGLADSNYQQQFANQQALFGNQQTLFSNANTQLQNQMNVLNNNFNQNASRIQVGENAATGSGTQGQAGATNSGNISVGLGNAQAASSIAQGNALSGGINSAANSVTQANALSQLTGNGSIFGNVGGLFSGNQNTAASNALQTQVSGDAPFFVQ